MESSVSLKSAAREDVVVVGKEVVSGLDVVVGKEVVAGLAVVVGKEVVSGLDVVVGGGVVLHAAVVKSLQGVTDETNPLSHLVEHVVSDAR